MAGDTKTKPGVTSGGLIAGGLAVLVAYLGFTLLDKEEQVEYLKERNRDNSRRWSDKYVALMDRLTPEERRRLELEEET